jgi:hypothetical protein
LLLHSLLPVPLLRPLLRRWRRHVFQLLLLLLLLLLLHVPTAVLR